MSLELKTARMEVAPAPTADTFRLAHVVVDFGGRVVNISWKKMLGTVVVASGETVIPFAGVNDLARAWAAQAEALGFAVLQGDRVFPAGAPTTVAGA